MLVFKTSAFNRSATPPGNGSRSVASRKRWRYRRLPTPGSACIGALRDAAGLVTIESSRHDPVMPPDTSTGQTPSGNGSARAHAHANDTAAATAAVTEAPAHRVATTGGRARPKGSGRAA